MPNATDFQKEWQPLRDYSKYTHAKALTQRFDHKNLALQKLKFEKHLLPDTVHRSFLWIVCSK